MRTRGFFIFVLAGVLAILAGCASLPSTEVMKAETASYQLPKLPESGKAIVYVVRPSGLGGLIRFNVFVDNQEAQSEVGYTRSSQYIYFNLAPGPHKIYSKAENWAEALVNVNAGDIVYIQQEPSMGVIMARNSIFKLADYQGKYHVKTLSLGTIVKPEAPSDVQAPGSAQGDSTHGLQVAPAVVPSSLTSATTTASAPAGGKDAYQAEHLAKDLMCNQAPHASLWAKGAGFENYSVACSNGDMISIRCEFGNCRVLQ